MTLEQKFALTCVKLRPKLAVVFRDLNFPKIVSFCEVGG